MARIDIRGIRREQILDAAERLVLSRGWADTTLAKLCKEAGVTNGVLVYHFKDKREIEAALWDRVKERWSEQLGRKLDSAQSLREAVEDLVYHSVQGDDDQLEVYYMLLVDTMCRAIYDPELNARLVSNAVQGRRTLAAQLREYRSDLAPDLDLGMAATIIRCVMIGAVMGRAALGVPKSAEFAQEIARLLLNYLTTGKQRHQSDKARGRRSATGRTEVPKSSASSSGGPASTGRANPAGGGASSRKTFIGSSTAPARQG